jgi:hypothetical protein
VAIHLIDDVFFEWQFNTGQVSSDKFLFQWRWKLKIYSVVDERRVDEMILEKKLAGDQQSQYISIFPILLQIRGLISVKTLFEMLWRSSRSQRLSAQSPLQPTRSASQHPT